VAGEDVAGLLARLRGQSPQKDISETSLEVSPAKSEAVAETSTDVQELVLTPSSGKGKKAKKPQEENRATFGQMLLYWRRNNGWTQYTACSWAEEAGFDAISYGNLSVIEQGKAGELRQKAFFQLEELNRRLAEKDWGPVKSQRLKDQLRHAEPLRGDDDKPWDAVDFWSCYIGYVPVPRAYQYTAPTVGQHKAKEFSTKWRNQMRRVVNEYGIEPSEALNSLADKASEQHRKRFYAVLTGFGDYSPQELAQLWIEGDVYLPKSWLDQWEAANRKGS